MRKTILGLMAFGAMAAIDASPAQARDYPFCIRGQQLTAGVLDCRFSTYEQCQATASGLRAYCQQNPAFAGYYDEPRPRSRRRGYTIYE